MMHHAPRAVSHFEHGALGPWEAATRRVQVRFYIIKELLIIAQLNRFVKGMRQNYGLF